MIKSADEKAAAIADKFADILESAPTNILL